MKNWGMLAVGLAGLMLNSGCGENTQTTPPPSSSSSKEPAAAAPEAAAKKAWDEKLGTETVSGAVTFDGEAMKPKKVMVTGDPFCEEQNKGDAAAINESLLVNAENKGIQNAFVYVKTGPVTEYSYPTPAALQIDQHGCVYKPHVSGVLAKQAVKVGSDDDTTHNVHWVSKYSGDKNESSKKGQFVEVTTKRAELGALFKCDIHGWMQAYVCIVSNPFFAVTDKDGKYTLPKLPAGDYEIGVWHETLGETTMKVKVEAGKAATANFTLKQK